MTAIEFLKYANERLEFGEALVKSFLYVEKSQRFNEQLDALISGIAEPRVHITSRYDTKTMNYEIVARKTYSALHNVYVEQADGTRRSV
jgi:hypothetical protein